MERNQKPPSEGWTDVGERKINLNLCVCEESLMHADARVSGPKYVITDIMEM